MVTATETSPRPRAGLAVAAVALAVALLLATRPLAQRLWCERGHDGARCHLEEHRGLTRSRASLGVDSVDVVRAATEGATGFFGGEVSYIRLGHQGRLRLPRRGLYLRGDGAWATDDRVVETATAFLRGEGARFELRAVDGVGAGAGGIVFAVIALTLVMLAERRSRVFTLSVDLDARTAHGRSVGLGGPTLDRTHPVGAEPRVIRTDDGAPPHLPMLRVASASEATLPILTGHAEAHGEALDQLAERVNAALTAGGAAGPSPSLALRFAPSVAIALTSIALLLRVSVGLATLPETEGTVALRNTAERCDYDGVTLLRGAEMQWSAPAGVSTRVFTLSEGMLRAHQVPVVIEVAPGRVTPFDCASLRSADGPVRARPLATPD